MIAGYLLEFLTAQPINPRIAHMGDADPLAVVKHDHDRSAHPLALGYVLCSAKNVGVGLGDGIADDERSSAES